MWGVFPDAIDWNIALHTQTLIWEANLRLDSKTPFRDGANFIVFYALKVFFWSLTSDTLTKKRNLSGQRNIPVYCLRINTPICLHLQHLIFFKGLKVVIFLKSFMEF